MTDDKTDSHNKMSSGEPRSPIPGLWLLLSGAVLAFFLGIWASTSWYPAPETDGPLQTPGAYRYVPGRAISLAGLVDHDGHPLDLDAFRGRWLLVNFGYLSCPDVCPLTLSLLNQVLVPATPEAKVLPDSARVLYATVDPARDTPERMKAFLAYFGDIYVGVTGSESTLTAFARQLNAVFVSQRKSEDEEHYTVSHSSSVALINPEGLFVAMLKGPDSADQLRQFLKEVVPQGQ
ncbi:MAG: SCO family protein [Hahellaceae bacterium]|nr:SCO family protein [Hahellaceae bacterium]